MKSWGEREREREREKEREKRERNINVTINDVKFCAKLCSILIPKKSEKTLAVFKKKERKKERERENFSVGNEKKKGLLFVKTSLS